MSKATWCALVLIIFVVGMAGYDAGRLQGQRQAADTLCVVDSVTTGHDGYQKAPTASAPVKQFRKYVGASDVLVASDDDAARVVFEVRDDGGPCRKGDGECYGRAMERAARLWTPITSSRSQAWARR